MVEIHKINIKGVDNEIVDFNARVKIEALEDGKQDKLTFDTEPKATSMNPVTSDGIFHAIHGIGTEGQADWTQTDTTKISYIKNKPTVTDLQGDWNETDTSKYSYIRNKPSVPTGQIQSDWEQTDVTKVDYIKNKPTDFTPKAHKTTHEKGGADELALDASQITTGTLDKTRVPAIDTSMISSIDGSKISGTLNAAQIPTLDASKIGTGKINNERLSGVQSALSELKNVDVTTWVSDTTYADYPYKATITYTGVTADHLAMVVFNVADATSGDYAPICKTDTDKVYIWSALNTAITIPTVTATKVL